MKWSTFYSDIPPNSVKLVPKRSGPPPIPPWIMGVVAIVLALIVCVVAYSFFAGASKASPAAAAASPTVDSPAAVAPAATPATAVLAPASPTALTPFRLPPVVTSTPVPPTPSLCDSRTAETRYVSDANGIYVFDSAQDGGKALGLLTFRTAVQTFGTIEGRVSSNSSKWFVVRYNNRCAYAWADAKESRLSTTKPK